jgi:TLD
MMMKSRPNSFVTSLFVIITLFTGVSSFAPQKSSLSSRILSSKLNSMVNWISGVTNSPPSKPLLTESLKSALTAGTSLQDKELDCVYKASNDGWSAIDFHKSVDERGSGLVVALSRSGQVFGGFNPLGWRSTDDYYQSNAAFLWYSDMNGDKATLCPILVGGTYGVA